MSRHFTLILCLLVSICSSRLDAVPGPDVIVGDVASLQQFGTSDTQVGLGMGTTFCNNGDAELNFFAMPNTDHPVLAQNLYRMSGGSTNDARFEQIGQAWLAHSFFALQSNACAFGCTPASGGTHLGVGCSTSDTASINAGQVNLGSRAWVNPFTGIFPSTANSHTGHAHSGTTHRVLVEGSDLNTTLNPGATYYAEAQLVTPHEFAWCQEHPGQCNMANNVSYRQFNVTGTTTFAFAAAGATVRMNPAINAWTGATINLIEPDPGTDGRAFIAYKVTNPSAGVWHYEYAIDNQTLDRAIQSFTVPLGCGITVSNLGFHAPLNHPGIANDGTEGDAGYSNAPWVSNQMPDNLNWHSETFAQNQNANAIRWGTLYNFRFDSNRPPQATNATIGFFKTGTPITVAIQGPSPDCSATPTPAPSPSGTPLPATHFSVVAPSDPIQFVPFPVTVTARDQFNNIVTNYGGTVHFTTTDTGAGIHLPPDSTLTNGTGVFSVTLVTPGAQTVTATDTQNSSITGTSNIVFVLFKGIPTPSPTPTATATAAPSPTPSPSGSPMAATHFSVIAPADPIQFVPFPVTVTARDQFNNIVTNYPGTVHFTTTDTGAGIQLPPDSMLTNGTGVFSVTLVTPGAQTVTATDTKNSSITGTSNIMFVLPKGIPTPSPTPTATGTASPTSTVTPTPTSTPTSTPTPGTSPQALNISTRLFVQTGDNAGIGGFIIAPSAGQRPRAGRDRQGPNGVSKQVLLRGIGPSLTGAGISNALANPTLDLRDSNGVRILANDNWRDSQEKEIAATGLAPTDDLEAAIVETLDPGSYTVILRGMGMTSGVGLVEIYDLDATAAAKLANLSTRGFVGTGSDIVITGFILEGAGDDRVVARGIGPSLTQAGVSNALSDPMLELRNSDGALLMSNNNWQDDSMQAAELMAAGLAPTNDLESGIAATLPPGLYTALLSGVNNGMGVGVVEIYDRGAP